MDGGPQLAGYRILRLIGRGAIGAVYLALDEASGEPVALKLVPLAGAGTGYGEDARAAFRRAADTASRLVHPDIVAVRASGEAGGQGWLAMEAVPGGDLGRYTRPPRLLPEPLLLRIGERLALALAHAHAQGVVHRDLKPANVLVHWPTHTVKLADFGLARLADAERTRTGLVLGSPAYMAPEQLAGDVPTPASDLYALGVTLFQLLAGRLPHDDSSLGELLRQVASVPAPDLRSLRPELPAALASVVAGLLAKRPADRPANAAQAADQLRTVRERL